MLPACPYQYGICSCPRCVCNVVIELMCAFDACWGTHNIDAARRAARRRHLVLFEAGDRHERNWPVGARPIEAGWDRSIGHAYTVGDPAGVEEVRREIRDGRVHAVLG